MYIYCRYIDTIFFLEIAKWHLPRVRFKRYDCTVRQLRYVGNLNLHGDYRPTTGFHCEVYSSLSFGATLEIVSLFYAARAMPRLGIYIITFSTYVYVCTSFAISIRDIFYTYRHLMSTSSFTQIYRSRDEHKGVCIHVYMYTRCKNRKKIYADNKFLAVCLPGKTF